MSARPRPDSTAGPTAGPEGPARPGTPVARPTGPGQRGASPAAHGEELLRRWGGDGGGVRVFFSPGRVNLFGGHLDYNGGPVMPTAIDRGTFLALRPRADRRVRLGSTLAPDEFEEALDALPDERRGAWYDYPVGVVRALLGEATGAGVSPHGLDVLFGGNLPIGSGLSSSASICVGTAFALDRVWRLGLDARARVDAALEAERGYVGVQCGIMDPYAVGFARPGHLLWLDCKDRTHEHLPIDLERVSIAVADTGVKRALAAVAFNERVAQCRAAFQGLAPNAPDATCLRDVSAEVLEAHGGELPPEVARRARHVVGEVERTFRAREAVLAGDLPRMGALMLETHESMRTHYEVSCDELDVLVDAAAEHEHAFGARLTGAGFGGCTVTLVRRGHEDEVVEHLRARFEQRFGRRPEVELFGGDEGPREVAGG